jgi:hypothetical protein
MKLSSLKIPSSLVLRTNKLECLNLSKFFMFARKARKSNIRVEHILMLHSTERLRTWVRVGLKRIARDEHSSLFVQCDSDEENVL